MHHLPGILVGLGLILIGITFVLATSDDLNSRKDRLVWTIFAFWIALVGVVAILLGLIGFLFSFAA